MESEEKKKAYNEYVERITPNNSLTKDMWNAFWIGGLICVMGQIWLELFMYFGMDKEDSASYTTLILILESAITGFANGVVSPAIEFKAEGHIFGIGAKIFTIAGPVILYGIFSSWIVGIIYLILKGIGIV